MPFSKTSRYAALPLFLTAVCFILLAPSYWESVETPKGGHMGRGFENIDLYERIYPFYHYAFSQLHLGNLPLWNPGQLCGAPLLNGSGLALFQPLNAMFWLMPTERAMALHAFAGLSLMGFSFVFFARTLGMRYMTGVIGAVVYTFGGTTAGAMSRPDLLAMLAWAPFLFWAMHELAVECRLRFGVAGGVALGLMLLSGAYGACLIMATVALAYGWLGSSFWGSIPPQNRRVQMWGLSFSLLIALSLSAVQWLPNFLWLFNLDNPWYFWGQSIAVGLWPASITDLPFHFLSSSPDKLPRIAYIGIGGIALAPLAFFHRFAKKDTIFFSIVAILFLILAIIGRGEGAQAVTELFIFPVSLALAVLVGLGLDCILGVRHPTKFFTDWVRGISFVLISLGLTYLSAPEARGRILPFVLVYLIFIMIRRSWSAAVATAIMGIVLYADLYSANANYYRHPFEDMGEIRNQINQVSAETSVQVRNERVIIVEPPLDMGIPGNLGMCSPLICANGRYIPLTTEQRQWWQSLGLSPGATANDTLVTANLDTLKSPLLDAMSVRAILTGISPDGENADLMKNAGLRHVRQIEGLHLYVNEEAVPHALWTPLWRAAPGITGALVLLQEDGFDVRRMCTVQSGTVAYKALTDLMPQAVSSPENVPWDTVECHITSSEAERVEISVKAPMPGITVLTDNFAPGWVAHLDGERTPIQKVNGLFRGVATPAGAHNIVFTYEPWEIWIGLGISSITCVALILGSLAHLVLVRKNEVVIS